MTIRNCAAVSGLRGSRSWFQTASRWDAQQNQLPVTLRLLRQELCGHRAVQHTQGKVLTLRYEAGYGKHNPPRVFFIKPPLLHLPLTEPRGFVTAHPCGTQVLPSSLQEAPGHASHLVSVSLSLLLGLPNWMRIGPWEERGARILAARNEEEEKRGP